MTYQEFVCAIEKRMNQKLEGGIKASQYTTVKNNGKVKKGLLIEAPGVNISPTIYLEEFYHRYLDGELVDELVQDILNFYRIVRCDRSMDTNDIEHYDTIQDKIVFKLVHTEKNRELLEGVPHIELLDLSIVFYVLLDVNSQGTATMTVNNEHLQYWDVTADELLALARKNVTRLLPAELFTMQQAVDEILRAVPGKRKNLLIESVTEADDFMYVLSNPIRSFGAACIVYPEVLDMAGQVLGEDYYVLPSSVHEVVLVPASKGMKPEDMNAMVTEINQTQVAEEEILSNHAYLYQREARRLVMQNSFNF
ncbi:hypothetical protein D3Z53_14955 [Lachnospiraceae bacterium]|nr:DUF5688 family protein [uncultured Schaedlerella sp.]EOS37633.1 hypothetical protein C808_03612 [Lachnospiraceae bacterium M18-1]MCI9153684.1 hypothetical protein [Ruminococcus sp.]NBI59329.1 hypothetical protein [Lachnospiraceae bacterium]